MKILTLILHIIFAPFVLLLSSNNPVNPNKQLKIYWIILISVVIVIGIVLLVYRNIIFG